MSVKPLPGPGGLTDNNQQWFQKANSGRNLRVAGWEGGGGGGGGVRGVNTTWPGRAGLGKIPLFLSKMSINRSKNFIAWAFFLLVPQFSCDISSVKNWISDKWPRFLRSNAMGHSKRAELWLWCPPWWTRTSTTPTSTSCPLMVS